MAHGRVYLLGFMGAGKSTIGRILAKRVGWKFIDLDEEIERGEGHSIREIFDGKGEAHFRQLEYHYLQELSTAERVIVALGGGRICRT